MPPGVVERTHYSGIPHRDKGTTPLFRPTFALPTPYLRRFILGFRYEIRG